MQPYYQDKKDIREGSSMVEHHAYNVTVQGSTPCLPTNQPSIPLAVIVEELKLYKCPKEIIYKLEEWLIDLAFDRGKLERWYKSQGIFSEE